MASVEVLAVGTELLLGRLTDTNSGAIARSLAEIGIDVRAIHVVGDNRERIAATMRDVLSRRDGAIATGGLGPTVDDLTREAACDALGVGMEVDGAALQAMEGFFATLGRPMPPNNRKQADVPAGSLTLRNPHGTAPGFLATREDGRFVACLPGPPREMRPMLYERLIPILIERYGDGQAIYARELHVVGLGESEIDRRIDDLFRAGENPKIGVLAHEGLVDVRITARSRTPESAAAAIAPLEAEIERRLHGHVFGYDRESLEEVIRQALQRGGRRVAVAESCTGGLVAAALTREPGSSETFVGGVVAYDNAVKIGSLGVDAGAIERDGAVSETVAVAMARGVRSRLGAEIGLSTTGIAGPSGGSAGKPVGTVWLGLASADVVRALPLHLPGDRQAVQRRAATAALALLWRYLTEGGSAGA